MPTNVNAEPIVSAVVDTDYVLVSTAAGIGPRRALRSVIGTPAGNTLVVNKTGSDTTGVRGRLDRPFLTLAAARTAASSGDTILVFPGAYTCTASLAKAGVNWHFFPGSSVTTVGTATAGIWDDGGTVMTFTVTGAGTFTLENTVGGGVQKSNIVCSHASSKITIECLDILCNDDSGDGDSPPNLICVNCVAGMLRITCRDVIVTSTFTAGIAIWWQNGSLSIEGRVASGPVAGIYSTVNATPTADADCKFDSIESAGSLGLYMVGTDSTAAIWVSADRIKGATQSVGCQGANRVYVKAQKLFGPIGLSGTGLVYIRTDKVSDVGGGALLSAAATGGTAWITVNHWDGTGVTVAAFTFNCAGATVHIIGGDYVSPAGGNGVSHTAGAVLLRGTRLNTAANSSGNPVTVAGSGLILDRCTLIANAGRECVTAGSAKTITNYSSKANTAKSANVTVNVDAIGVDSNVV